MPTDPYNCPSVPVTSLDCSILLLLLLLLLLIIIIITIKFI